jgi:G3E family GTPase
VERWLGMVPQAAPDPLAGLSGFAPTPAAPAFAPAAPMQGRHDSCIVSASITVPEPIPATVFDLWLDTLIALKGPNILRMKGIVHVEGMDHPFAFHGVQHIFEPPVPMRNWSGADLASRVVVIARDMQEAELQASLEMLLLRPKEGAEVEHPGGMMVETIDMPF